MDWNSQNITFLTDCESNLSTPKDPVTREIILGALEDVPKGDDDFILFFFSGHGEIGTIRAGDFDPDNPENYYPIDITDDDLYNAISNNGQFKQYACFINSCYSGTLLSTLTQDSNGLAFGANGDKVHDASIPRFSTLGIDCCIWPTFLITYMRSGDRVRKFL